MDKEKFLNSGLMELYVLGLASPEEQEIVMDYALAYPDIQETLDLSVDALEEYAKAHSVAPPADLRKKISDDIEKAEKIKIHSETVEQPTATKSSLLVPLFFIGMLAFGILAGIFFQKNRQGATQYEDLQKEYADFKEDCEAAKRLKESQFLEYDFLKDKNTVAVNLIGTPISPKAKAVVFWNKNKKASYLKIVNLPKPQKEKQYQLWADIDGEMVNLGVFDLKENDLIKINFKENTAALNITLEKLGGVQHPTIEQLHLSGKI